jgi:hypothetical protein
MDPRVGLQAVKRKILNCRESNPGRETRRYIEYGVRTSKRNTMETKRCFNFKDGKSINYYVLIWKGKKGKDIPVTGRGGP